MRTVADLIKGMPHSQQGRGRTLYAMGRQSAVEEVRDILDDNREKLAADAESAIRQWVADNARGEDDGT